MSSKPIRTSVVSSLFLNYPIRDAIAQIARAGFDGIDIWGGRPHIYRQDYTRDELESLRRFLQDQHVAVSSFMPAFFRYPYSLSNPNEIVRQDSVEYMRRCMDNAMVLGAPILLIIPGKCLRGQSPEDARKRMVESIHEISRYAAQYDIWLGLEPANRMVTDLVNTTSDALGIIQEVGYPKLGVVLDSGHLNLTREPVEDAVRNLGNALLQFHVNDNDGCRQQNLIPGEGTYDFKRLVSVLRGVNYKGFMSAELGWDYTADPEAAILECQKRMSSFLS